MKISRQPTAAHHLRTLTANMVTGLLLAWAGAAAAANVAEDEADLAAIYGDKEFISLATGSKQPLRRAPAVATVITADDIATSGATDLDEVLETVPGLHVSRSTSVNQPIYVMRGIYSNPTNPQILLLQNGVPMTMLYTGDKGNVWGGLPLENLARIEIIRGPGSALYGADAYAGVINLITKTAAEVHGTELGARAGSFNSQDAWVQHGGKLGTLDVAAYLRIGSTEGQKEVVAQDAQSVRDRASGTRASRAPGPLSTGGQSLDASLDLSRGKWRLRAGYKRRDDLGMGVGAASSLDPASRANSERTHADVAWTDTQLAPHLGVGLQASYLNLVERTDETNLMLNPPGTRIGPSFFPNGMVGGPNRWERSTRLSAFASYTGLAGHHLRAGLGHDELDLYQSKTYKNFLVLPSGLPTPTGPVIEYSAIQPHIAPQLRTNNYLYGQDEWNLRPDWTLTAGVRRDVYSDFGGTTNPRLALVWDTTLDLTSKLLWGQAFRAPAFIEAYGINPSQSGNPAIRPERLRSLELAFNWAARKDLQVNLNLFRYNLADMIRAVANPTPGTGATWQNTGSQRGTGGELEAVWDASRALRVSSHYAWQHATDQASGQDAGYAPQDHYFVRADWRVGGSWQLSAQANRVENRQRAANDTRAPVPDYTSLDLTVRRSLNKHWELSASVRNLLDATILEPTLPGTVPTDLPQAGRSAYLQAVYKL
jgi:outer membrane receptor protein involved in Fe transport